MARLIPYLVCFAFGFFVALLLGSRRSPAEGGDWEAKYRDLYQRYRDLTRRLEQYEEGAAAHQRLERCRQALWDVRGMLVRPENLTAGRARSAVEEIDEALAQ